MGCEATSYPNNLTSADLDALEASLHGSSNSQVPFDICGTGSPEEHNGYLCGYVAYLKNRKRILNGIAAMVGDWSLAQKSALATLEAAESTFGLSTTLWEGPALTPGTDATTSLEPFQTGSVQAAFDDDFFSSMQTLIAKSPQSADAAPAGPAQADVELNRNYRTLMDRLRVPRQEKPNFLLNPQVERGIERDWIAYRDAWAALVAARFGPERAAAWHAKMTAQRGAMLAKLSSVVGPPSPEAIPWLTICALARAAPLPPDITAEPTRPQDPVCASWRPYYGIGTAVDFIAARQCAIAERGLIYPQRSPNIAVEGPGAQIGEEIDGSVMLAMLYANGQGVPRNILLAQRFACEAIDDQQIASDDGFASDEKRAAVPPALLEAIASPVPPHLDMCNYVGPLARALDMCEFIAMTDADVKRTAALDAVAKSMTPGEKTAYDRLLTALHAYFSAHDHNEVAVMGHYLFSGGWQGISMEREQAFLEDMQSFERGEREAWLAYVTKQRTHDLGDPCFLDAECQR